MSPISCEKKVFLLKTQDATNSQSNRFVFFFQKDDVWARSTLYKGVFRNGLSGVGVIFTICLACCQEEAGCNPGVIYPTRVRSVFFSIEDMRRGETEQKENDRKM